MAAFSEEFCTDVRLPSGKTEICTVVNTFTSLFRIHLPHEQQKELRLYDDRLSSQTSSLIVIWMVMAPVPVILLLFVVPRAVLVILLVSSC